MVRPQGQGIETEAEGTRIAGHGSEPRAHIGLVVGIGGQADVHAEVGGQAHDGRAGIGLGKGLAQPGRRDFHDDPVVGHGLHGPPDPGCPLHAATHGTGRRRPA